MGKEHGKVILEVKIYEDGWAELKTEKSSSEGKITGVSSIPLAMTFLLFGAGSK